MKSYRFLLYYFLFCLVLIVGCIGIASAATVTLTCIPPTQNTDNTPITVPLSYKVYWGVTPTALTDVMVWPGPACVGSVGVRDPAPGISLNYYFAVTAVAAGMESAKSNAVVKVVATPLATPNPPGLVLIVRAGAQVFNTGTFDPKVWAVKPNKLYGTVLADVKCDESKPAAGGYYRIPTTAVKWANPLARTPYPMAKCERV